MYKIISLPLTGKRRATEAVTFRGNLVIVPLAMFFVLFLATTGCKYNDKGDPVFPFFGGKGAQVPPPPTGTLNAMPQTAMQPVVVQDGPGPVTVTNGAMYPSAVQYSTTPQPNPPGTPAPGASGSYAPPALVNPNPTGTPSASTSYTPQSAMTTTAYEAPPNANVNSGAYIGSIPQAYTATPATSSTSNTQPGNGSASGTVMLNGGNTSSNTSSGSGYGVQNQNTAPTSQPNSSYNQNVPGGLGNSTSVDANGYFMSPDGTKSRMIGGRAYTLTVAQYPINSGPSNIPGTVSTSPPNYGQTYDPGSISPVSSPYMPNYPYQPGGPNNPATSDTSGATQAQMVTPQVSDATAEQSTRLLGDLPISGYESLLNPEQSNIQGFGHGLVTTIVPTQLNIQPSEATEKAVESLDLSQYSDIGAIAASGSASPTGNADNQNDNSLWGTMARQDQNYLLYQSQAKGQVDKNDQMQYIALNEPVVGDIFSRGNRSIATTTGHTYVMPPYCQSEIILGQSPCVPCCPPVVYFWR